MITFDTFYTIQRVSGLSQDDKPMGMKPGSIFMELDTGKTFIFDGETWHEQPSGGGEQWELINTVEPTEEASALHIDKDSNGEYFNLKKALLLCTMQAYTGAATVPNYAFTSVNNKISGVNAPLVYTKFLTPSASQSRTMYYLVEVSQNGKPYHEHLAKTNATSIRNIGSSNGEEFDFYCIDGTEPATSGITEIGTAGNLIYSGCYFALYGVRV